MSEPCPCGSNQAYESCCRPFHEQKALPNPEQLVRSRFAAFAKGLYDYLIDTTHPANPQYSFNRFQWKRQLHRFSHKVHFQKLTLHEVKENGVMATVVFTVHAMENDHPLIFTEKSYFERWRGKWLYLRGKLAEGVELALCEPSPLKVLPLAYFGQEILHQKAQPIAEVSEAIQNLALEMIATMDAFDGVGLAGPQVHQSLRLFVLRAVEGEQERTHSEAIVFINPEIRAASQELKSLPEGCLSIPGLHAEVARSTEITLEYTNLAGERLEGHFTGLAAKAIAHEYDHLEGILYIERLSKELQGAMADHLQCLSTLFSPENSTKLEEKAS